MISLPVASLIRLSNLFHSLGADAQKDSSPYIAVWLIGTLNSEKGPDSKRSFGSDYRDTVLLFHSVL